MTEKLTPGAECSRHVKAADTTCPFCGAAMVAAPVPTAPYRRLAAAAAVAGVAALAGCSTTSSGFDDRDGSTPSGVPFDGFAGQPDEPDGSAPSNMAFYGLPGDPFIPTKKDAGADASSDGGASVDASGDAETPADASGDSETADASGDGESAADASSDASDGG
jgi:hypothetical protein